MGPIAVRVGLVPLPGAGDDGLDIGVARVPAQQTTDLVGAGDEDGWISGAARHVARRNRMAGNFAREIDDLGF